MIALTVSGQMYSQHYVRRRQDKTDRYKNKQYFPAVVLHYYFVHTTPVILRKSPSAVKDSFVGISAGAYHKSDTESRMSFSVKQNRLSKPLVHIFPPLP